MRSTSEVLAVLSTALLASGNLAISLAGEPTGIQPLDGCAWLGSDGIRAAWLSYKQIDDEMVGHLLASRVNSVFLRHGFHDLLQLDTARWDGEVLLVDPKEETMRKMIANTRRAAESGIHVFWIANYELDQMLPHLERLDYQSAFAEGPSRYLRPGAHRDAAPLDRTFWRGFTGAHGELVARLSREHPIDGLLYDTEHYAGGIMYLENAGFSDSTFETYVSSRRIETSAAAVPAGQRHEYLKNSGRLPDYYHFLAEEAYRQGRDLAARWHAVNPHLILGIWPLLDNWFSRGFLGGLGGAVPSLGLSGVEYYHGSDQSQSMAEYFESRNPNLIYVPGFYPPYAYSVDQLRSHLEQALRKTGHYWMLGPHEELCRPDYQTAMRSAFESAMPQVTDAVPPVGLRYRVEARAEGPVLVVETEGKSPSETLHLSLWSTAGGSPLCNNVAMRRTALGAYTASVPLRRRITNNRYLPDGFRSGASYRFDLVPREFRYEDPDHTKLIDGRAYGYFGTTVAWSPSVDRAAVTFDLHRPYRIVRVEVSQPAKLEDRVGGPAKLSLQVAERPEAWQSPRPLEVEFSVDDRNLPDHEAPPDDPTNRLHGRAWLAWKTELPETTARWVRIDLERIRPNSSLSLGEVVICADFDGEVGATIRSGGKAHRVGRGQRYIVPALQ